MIVLDACVLAAFVDPANLFHRHARSIMGMTEPFAISALTGAEVMVPSCHQPLPAPAFWPALFADFDIHIIDLTGADMARLAALRAASRLKMPDAIVLHTAMIASASIATFDAALRRAAFAHGVPVIDQSVDTRTRD